MTGFSLVAGFVVAIILMIIMISKLKIHPFISIMVVALILGLYAGIPLVGHTTGGGSFKKGIVDVIATGFSSVFASIGIVIILGALIGAVLESTGGAFKLADIMVKLVGKKHPEVAVTLMGWVVSISVFCDSGFVILSPIRKALVQRTAVSSVMLTIGLSCGLYAAHVFIPPTPGPIAAAGTLGLENDLLLVIGIGILASILPLICGVLYARFIGTKIQAADEASTAQVGMDAAQVSTAQVSKDAAQVSTVQVGKDATQISEDAAQVSKDYEELAGSYEKIPSTLTILAPIVVPIILMALGSTASMLHCTGLTGDMLVFLGKPVIALGFGVVFSYLQLVAAGKAHTFYDLIQDTLQVVGPILFVTAAGSVLGSVISNSGLVDFIKSLAHTMQTLGIFFPFLLAAILKTSQGSSTVAITTTSAIIAPLMHVLGFTTPVSVALCVMAIGAGAMTVSHANDSYFWVVTNFGAMSPEQGYTTQTVATAIMGVSAIVGIWALLCLCSAFGL